LLLSGAYALLAVVAVILGRRYVMTREPDAAVEPSDLTPSPTRV